MTAAITINFRKPALTVTCVESLLTDGWSPILVWDNSNDGGACIRGLEERLGRDPRVHLVPSAVNLGFGAGMNHALAELGRRGYAGPVLLVNNDARVRPGLRAAMEAVTVESCATTLIAPRIVQDGIEQGWLYYQPWFALVTKRPVWGSFRYLSGCCLLVSRPDNAAPLFDEEFFMYGEDVELSYRVMRGGGRLVLLDGVYIEHVGSASSGQASETYERNMVHSHWLLVTSCTRNFASRMLLYAARMVTLSLRAVVRSVRFRSLTPLRALGAIGSHR